VPARKGALLRGMPGGCTRVQHVAMQLAGHHYCGQLLINTHCCVNDLWLSAVRRGDVLSAWSGIRPLVLNPNARDTQSIARNHIIEVSRSNLITIAGLLFYCLSSLCLLLEDD